MINLPSGEIFLTILSSFPAAVFTWAARRPTSTRLAFPLFFSCHRLFLDRRPWAMLVLKRKRACRASFVSAHWVAIQRRGQQKKRRGGHRHAANINVPSVFFLAKESPCAERFGPRYGVVPFAVSSSLPRKVRSLWSWRTIGMHFPEPWLSVSCRLGLLAGSVLLSWDCSHLWRMLALWGHRVGPESLSLTARWMRSERSWRVFRGFTVDVATAWDLPLSQLLL